MQGRLCANFVRRKDYSDSRQRGRLGRFHIIHEEERAFRQGRMYLHGPFQQRVRQTAKDQSVRNVDEILRHCSLGQWRRECNRFSRSGQPPLNKPESWWACIPYLCMCRPGGFARPKRPSNRARQCKSQWRAHLPRTNHDGVKFHCPTSASSHSGSRMPARMES
jgi:hypothetical protein